MSQHRPLFNLFCLFKHTLQILQQIHLWKNVHPVYGAGIRTHDHYMFPWVTKNHLHSIVSSLMKIKTYFGKKTENSYE